MTRHKTASPHVVFDSRYPGWTRIALAGVLLFLLLPGRSLAAEYSGVADWTRANDGDTFWLCATGVCTKIRLCGIDAPEADDSGGRDAGAALKSIVADHPVRCVQVGDGTLCDGRSKPTNGDRVVAQCFAAGRDIALEMVQQGQACDWIAFSNGAYAAVVPSACRK